jgi:TonB-linked SusC/RagA family outer membrane protein
MRVLLLCLLCSIGLTYAADGHAQRTLVSVNVVNQRVEDVLKQLEEQSGYGFFFNNKHVDLNRRVSVSADKSDIFGVLNEVFAGTNVRYSVMDKKIVLTVASQAPQQAKPVTVSGVVLDEHGDPIIGASIIEKGANGVGTVTDIDGNFHLTVGSDRAVLEVSYVGYQKRDLKVTPGKALKVTLQEDSKMLDELVVVGYGVQKKRDLTGAVASVKMSDEPVGTFSTVSHALAGKAAGLRVTQISGQPGAQAKFRIRGETSINAGNDPLIIIDGFPISSSKNQDGLSSRFSAGDMDNVLESINPNDIESIEVLKDASATAIYGSRAGHGVIIVTTKRGKKNDRLSVSYSGNVSVQTIAKNYEVMDGPEYRKFRNDRAYEIWMKTNAQGIYKDYIAPPAKGVEPYKPRYTDAEMQNIPTTNWVDEVTRTGIQHSHNLSISGGTEKLQFLTSLNYFNQDGVVKNNGVERLTAKMNMDYTVSHYVKLGVSLNASRNKYDNMSLGQGANEYAGVLTSAGMFDPSIPVYDKNGKFSEFTDQAQLPNPVSLLDVKDNTIKDRLLMSGYAQVEPTKGLILKATLGFDRRSAKRKQYVPKTTKYGASQGGLAQQSQDDGLDYLMDLTANYMKTFGKHSITALVGYEYQKFTTEGFWLSNYDFPLDAPTYNSMNQGAGVKGGDSSASVNSLGSYFARVNYSYMDRYLLTASIRWDGAANFDPKYRWGSFPSVSAAWRFSDEAFLKGASNWLSNGKLRMGYGQTGNSNVGNRTLNYFGSGSKYAFGDSGYNGMKLTQWGNPHITWETTSEFNIGLDLGFLNNRINLTAEYYHRVISDLLVTNKKIPAYNEINTISGNIGKTQGQGIELTLNTTNIATKDLTWESTLTFYKYVDRWKERDPNWKPYVYEKTDDYIRSYFVYKSNGLLQPGEKAPAWQPSLLPGQVKLQNLYDQEGTSNVLDQYDKVLLGSKDPNFSFGFNNTLRYKELDFNIYFYGEVGRWRAGSYYDQWIPALDKNNYNMSKAAVNSWSSENLNTTIPSMINSDYDAGDYFYKKISYLRCRNITVGYTIPMKEKKIAQNIRVYVDINNPFVITNWTGLDPETDRDPTNYATQENFSLSSYPNVRSFSLGLEMRF